MIRFSISLLLCLCLGFALSSCGGPAGGGSGLEEIVVIAQQDGGTERNPLPESTPEPVSPEALPESTPEPISPEAPPESTSEPIPPEAPPESTSEPRPEPTPETSPDTPSTQRWIGEACNNDAQCAYNGGKCLLTNYPNGMCSLSCARTCPDKTGHAVTFCIDAPGAFASAGACVSKCDFNLNPQTGCRQGYYCTSKGRYNDTSTQAMVCVPGTGPTPTCYQQVAQLGLQFTVRNNPKEHPVEDPSLTCDVIDALSLEPTLHGVTWVNGNNTASAMFMRCEFALAMSKFSKYLAARGITKVMHYGTYNCRGIRTDSGQTANLSQHGLGRAIDLAAFWNAQGVEYNLYKHWDHSTTWKNASGQMGCWSSQFNSPQAKVLYEIGCDMWKQNIFSLVLTPNYNNVHDNHFHVDLSSNGKVYTPFPLPTIQPHDPSPSHSSCSH